MSVVQPTPESPLFSLAEVPTQSGARWFLERQGQTYTAGGFRSKAEASAWIDNLGRSRLDWRAGFVFKLRGDVGEMKIVDRHGVVAKAG